MSELVEPFRRLLPRETLERLASEDDRKDAIADLLEIARTEVAALLDAALMATESAAGTSTASIEGQILTELETVFELAQFAQSPGTGLGEKQEWAADLGKALNDAMNWATLLAWVFVRHLGEVGGRESRVDAADETFAEWHLRSALVDLVIDLGRTEDDGRRAAIAVELMIEAVRWRSKDKGLDGIGRALAAMIGKPKGQQYLRFNRHADVLWFHREAFEELLRWMMLVWVSGGIVEDSEGAPSNLEATDAVWTTLVEAAEASGFRLVEFTEILNAADDLVAAED
jgi:hypothetical protein